MKIIFTAALLLTFLISTAQSFKADPNYIKRATNDIGYMLDTVVQSNYKKQQLYSNTMAYLSNTYKDSRYVVEAKDLGLGEITFNGLVKTYAIHQDTSKKGKIRSYEVPIGLEFKCKVYLKDEKFRIIMNSLDVQLMYGFPGIPLDPYAVKLGEAENKSASRTAILILRDVCKAINRKPENDF